MGLPVEHKLDVCAVKPDQPVLTGYQIADGSRRVFFVEGPRASMERLSAGVPRGRANSDSFKILRSDGMGFGERLFAKGTMKLPTIRLFESLSGIMLHPEFLKVIKSKQSEKVRTLVVDRQHYSATHTHTCAAHTQQHTREHDCVSITAAFSSPGVVVSAAVRRRHHAAVDGAALRLPARDSADGALANRREHRQRQHLLRRQRAKTTRDLPLVLPFCFVLFGS